MPPKKSPQRKKPAPKKAGGKKHSAVLKASPPVDVLQPPPVETPKPQPAPETASPVESGTVSHVESTEPSMAVEGHPGEPGMVSYVESTQPAFWHAPENLLLTFFFAVMMVLPLLDILARKLHPLFAWFPPILVPGSLNLVQHTVLAIMMFGGAIAAREGKLLQLATTASLIPPRFKAAAHIATAGLGAAITLYLVKAGWNFVLIEKGVGSIIALGIPEWVFLLFLPVGFSIILLRMIWRSSDKWNERLITLLVAGWLAYLAPMIHNPSWTFLYCCFGLLMVAVIFGMPVFLVLGGAALVFLWNSDTPIDSIPAETYRMVVSPTIPTIPLFTLTGYFLAEGGASQRLLRVFEAFFGSLKGGPAIVTACVCAFFTAFTGGSGVTILALGGLLMPILLAEKYKERDALGLLTSAGSLGMLFPPSLPVILYGVVAGTSIKDLFLGGFMPGMILLFLTALWGILKASKENLEKYSILRALKLWLCIGPLTLAFLAVLAYFGWKEFAPLAWSLLSAVGGIKPDSAGVGAITFVQVSRLVFVLALCGNLFSPFKKWLLDKLSRKLEVEKEVNEALEAAWDAKWELALPFVVFFFLFVIKVTLVESAALTALYAFLVEVVFYRKMRLNDVPKVITECGILVGGVLLILGVSLGFTNDMVDAQIPAQLAAWVHNTVHSQWVFLLMVNFMLIVVGSLLEIFAAIVVVVPLLMPMSDAFGVDRVHMGIIFLANMELGFIAPPLGLNLFLSSYRFKKTMTEVYIAVLPMYLILHAMVFAITYIPFLTTWLPQWVAGHGW